MRDSRELTYSSRWSPLFGISSFEATRRLLRSSVSDTEGDTPPHSSAGRASTKPCP